MYEQPHINKRVSWLPSQGLILKIQWTQCIVAFCMCACFVRVRLPLHGTKTSLNCARRDATPHRRANTFFFSLGWPDLLLARQLPSTWPIIDLVCGVRFWRTNDNPLRFIFVWCAPISAPKCVNTFRFHNSIQFINKIYQFFGEFFFLNTFFF